MNTIYTYNGTPIQFKVDNKEITVACEDIVKLYTVTNKNTKSFISAESAIEFIEAQKNPDSYRWLMNCIRELKECIED